jgi:hypothetical protein
VSLNALRKVRNKFAHADTALHFESLSVRGLLEAHNNGKLSESGYEYFFRIAELVEVAIVKAAGLPDQARVAQIHAVL